jgi:hypothetical protein
MTANPKTFEFRIGNWFDQKRHKKVYGIEARAQDTDLAKRYASLPDGWMP